MDTKKIEEYLLEHEGYKQFAYDDPLGYITVGIGRCLDPRRGRGITLDEAFYLLRNDIKDCQGKLEKYNWYNDLDEVRRGVMIELCFNVGLVGLLKFKKTIKFLEERNFACASVEMLNSRWARQVGRNRSSHMAYRLAHGAHPV